MGFCPATLGLQVRQRLSQNVNLRERAVSQPQMVEAISVLTLGESNVAGVGYPSWATCSHPASVCLDVLYRSR